MNSKSNIQKGSVAASATFSSNINVPLVIYQALHISDTFVRKVWFEAAAPEDARSFALKCGLGLQGEAQPAGKDVVPHFEPAGVFSVNEACRHLGGISRTSLYRLLVRNKLKRLPDTRKVLVTRRSIDRYLDRAA